MKIGISISSSYLVEDVRDGARQMVDRARAAAQAGLDSLFVGDHHVVPTPYYQNTPMLGRLLAEWNDRPAGALFLLPLWNPVLVAEQVATLACISQGPFILQCGLGRDQYQFDAMGADIRYRPSAFEQAIGVLRQLWQGESVSLSGRWQFKDARIAPLPPEPIKIWIGASAPVAIQRAARLGDAWLADPGMNLQQARESIDVYQEALADCGNSVDTIALRRDVYVAESPEEADMVRQLITEKGYRGFDPSALVIGNPEQVASTFSDYGAIGYTDIIIRNLHRDPDRAVASTERMAEVKALLS